jgi:L-threonylcarbamoyladenylate synthase
MDGTLYRSAVLDQRYEESIYQMVAERKRVSLAQARIVFRTCHETLAARLKVRPSKLFTLNEMGISDRVWAARQGRCVKPGAVLKPDLRLRKMLLELSADFRLAVVTNNHRANTLETLACLGIGECFDEIMTLSESRCFKPSSELYRDMAGRLRVDPAECLSVGDRYHLDLEPAAAIGMHTVLVQSMQDVYQLPKYLLPACAETLVLRNNRGLEAAAKKVAAVLKAGHLAVLPTDTVYGLSAIPATDAVRWIYRAKGRAKENPLVLLLADAREAAKYARVTPKAQALMQQHWPGGLTLVLPAKPGTSWGKITRGGRTLALRVPDNAFMQKVIRLAGGALATTSANRSGEPAPITAQTLDARMLAFVHLVVDSGPCPVKIPSTVARVQGKRIRILRPGAVAL